MADYVPRGDLKFLEWVKRVTSYILANHARWEISDPKDRFDTPLGEFESAMANALLPDAGSVSILEKNNARKKLERMMREYLQGVIIRNPAVLPVDKAEMSLPVYDRTPTPVLDPTSRATASVIYKDSCVLQLNIKSVTDIEDKRSEYGCRIYYGVYATGSTPPATGMDLIQSMFTRKKKEVFTFLPTETGKTVYFCIRYENSKGKAGPWGPMISAIIP